jgi:glutaminyl-peptide cyclotransferase
MHNKIFAVVLVLFSLACNSNENKKSEVIAETAGTGIPEAAVIPYTIINVYPHDTSAYTQGLEVYKGIFLESTGRYCCSTLRKVDPVTGKPSLLKKMDSRIFGEGLTVLRDTIYQLTWREHIVYVYDPKDFRLIRQMNWTSEGWGITNDGKSLIISDGTDKLYIVEPAGLKLQKVISVSDNLGPLNNINELEYVNGHIYANRYGYNFIVKIDPANGHVVGTMDFTDVLKKYSKSDLTFVNNNADEAVLNGIAWDPVKKKMYITGKQWPNLFELQMEP